jgi:hypothetical protein
MANTTSAQNLPVFGGYRPLSYFSCYFEVAIVDDRSAISNLKISGAPKGVSVKNGNTVYGFPLQVGVFEVTYTYTLTKIYLPGEKQRGNSSFNFSGSGKIRIDKSMLYLRPSPVAYAYDGKPKLGKFEGKFQSADQKYEGALKASDVTFFYSPVGKNEYSTNPPSTVGEYDIKLSTPYVSEDGTPPFVTRFSDVVISTAGTYVTSWEKFGDRSPALVITKIDISNSIQITGLSKTYTGQAQGISGVTMTPANQPYTVSYTTISVADVSSNADTGAPTAAGTYQVVVNVDGVNYSGTKTETLTINKATATAVVLAGAKKYTGAGLAANFSAKLGSNSIPVSSKAVISATYNGVASLPINAGTYQVAVTINDPNYTATGTGIFTILPEAPKLLSDTLFKMSAKVGRLATYQIVFTDPSNRPITSFNCKNLPLSLSLNPDTGFITGVIDFFGPKSFTVAVSGPGGEANGTLTIEGLADTIFLGEASPIDTFGDAQKIYLGGRLLYP